MKITKDGKELDKSQYTIKTIKYKEIIKCNEAGVKIYCGHDCKIDCRNDCEIYCWNDCEIFCGHDCKIDCGYNCRIDCWKDCEITARKGTKVKYADKEFVFDTKKTIRCENGKFVEVEK